MAARAGTMEATVTWQDRNIELRMACQLNDPPYTQCPGTYNRVNDTSGRFTSAGVADDLPRCWSRTSRGAQGAEPFTIVIRYP